MSKSKSLLFAFIVYSLSSLTAYAEPGRATILTDYLIKDSEGTYHITLSQHLPYNSFSIKNRVLTLKGPDGVKSFSIKTDLTIEKLQGIWFEYTKTSTTETSTKITRRTTDYDFETVELDHKEKTYYSTQKDDLGVKYRLINNAIIDENTEYFYFVQSYSKDAIQFVDTYGETFTEKRFTGEKLLNIPQNYKRRDD